MKTALIGLANNVSSHIDKIKLWANSFKRFSDGEVILLCANSTEEEVSLCLSIGITPAQVRIDDAWYINHKRLKATADYLRTSDVGVCIVTDVFDVMFQRDPFTKLDTELYDLFVSGEGVLVSQEPWNSDNIKKIFPDEYQKCLSTEVINSGVIAGKREQLVALYDTMYEMCEKGSNAHNIKDQASLIVLVSNQRLPRLKIFNLDDAWAMHCAVAGPTQFFEGWGFKNVIRYGIPKMVDDHVVTAAGERFAIVHQFNRVPAWKAILEKSV
jgi:hypothetical protein